MLAVITFRQIVELLVLIVLVHAVLLGPVMVALVGAWGERADNEPYRPRV